MNSKKLSLKIYNFLKYFFSIVILDLHKIEKFKTD